MHFIEHLVGWLLDSRNLMLIDRLIDCLFDALTDWLTNVSVDWLIAFSVFTGTFGCQRRLIVIFLRVSEGCRFMTMTLISRGDTDVRRTCHRWKKRKGGKKLDNLNFTLSSRKGKSRLGMQSGWLTCWRESDGKKSPRALIEDWREKKIRTSHAAGDHQVFRRHSRIQIEEENLHVGLSVQAPRKNMACFYWRFTFYTRDTAAHLPFHHRLLQWSHRLWHWALEGGKGGGGYLKRGKKVKGILNQDFDPKAPNSSLRVKDRAVFGGRRLDVSMNISGWNRD